MDSFPPRPKKDVDKEGSREAQAGAQTERGVILDTILKVATVLVAVPSVLLGGVFGSATVIGTTKELFGLYPPGNVTPQLTLSGFLHGMTYVVMFLSAVVSVIFVVRGRLRPASIALSLLAAAWIRQGWDPHRQEFTWGYLVMALLAIGIGLVAWSAAKPSASG